MTKPDIMGICRRVCNGTISDEEYQYFLQLCKKWGMLPLEKGCGFGSMWDRMEHQDELIYQQSLLKQKQKEEQLKNKYKF